MDVVRPVMGISVQPDSENKLWMGLDIQTDSMQVKVFLCRADDYMNVAKEIHEKIMQAGKEMRRAESGLIVANGALPNATKQGPTRRG